MDVPWKRLPKNQQELLRRATPEPQDREDQIENHPRQSLMPIPDNTPTKPLVQMDLLNEQKRNGRTELWQGKLWPEWYNHAEGGWRSDREFGQHVDIAMMMADFKREWQLLVDAAFATPPVGSNVVPFPPRR